MLISYKSDVNLRDNRGKTALTEAIVKNHLDIVKILLTNGANAEYMFENFYKKGRGSMTPFENACIKGDLDLIKLLIYYRYNEYYKNQALLLTIANNRLDVVEYLLDIGADPNLNIEGFKNPLSCAAEYGYLEIIKLLLEKAADINIKDVKNGSSALMYALLNKKDKVAKLLVEKGADVNHKNFNNNTVLMFALGIDTLEQDPKFNKEEIIEREEIIKLILSKEIDVNAKNDDGESALLMLTRKFPINSIAALLIERGADVNVKSSRKRDYSIRNLSIDTHESIERTPIMYAAASGNLDLVNTLITKGAEIYSLDCRKRNCLVYAALGGNYDIINLFIKKGIKIDELSEYLDFTPFTFAVRECNSKTVELFLDNGADVNGKTYNDETNLMHALRNKNIDTFYTLIERGCFLNSLNKGEKSVLELTTDLEHIKILVSSGAEIKLNSLNYSHLINYIDKDLTKMLVAKGVDINALSPDKETVFSTLFNKKNHSEKELDILIENGVDIRIKNGAGITPLMYLIMTIDYIDGLRFNERFSNYGKTESMKRISKLLSKDTINQADYKYKTAVLCSLELGKKVSFKKDIILKLINYKYYNFSYSIDILKILSVERNEMNKSIIIKFLDNMKNYYKSLDGNLFDLLLANSKLHSINIFSYDLELQNKYIESLREIIKFISRTSFKFNIDQSYISCIDNLSVIDRDIFSNIIKYFDKTNKRKKLSF